MVWLATRWLKNVEDTFVHFDRIRERDGRTDGQIACRRLLLFWIWSWLYGHPSSSKCHPITHLTFIDDEVEQMLQAGVIEHSSSPWSRNMVLAKKTNGLLWIIKDWMISHTKIPFCFPRVTFVWTPWTDPRVIFDYGLKEWFFAGGH